MTEPRRRRNLIRLIVTPLVILLVAGGISVWSKRREAERAAAIEAFVRGVITGGQTDPGWPTGLDREIERLRADGLLDPSRTAVQVAAADPGDRLPGTHTALVEIDGAPRLGLRLAWADESPIAIVGYWRPQPPGS